MQEQEAARFHATGQVGDRPLEIGEAQQGLAAPGAGDGEVAVLCHGDLTVTRAGRSEPLLRFADFERTVADLARCVKPGGLLFLHTTNFRFCDTAAASGFDTVLEARPEQLAPDVLYDRDGRLMPGERYLPVGFRKRTTAG